VSSIATITFFRFRGIRNQFWGFTQMQFAHKALGALRGQTFYRLMGSGRGEGFNPWPDWSAYALLQVWENEKAADDFFSSSEIIGQYRQHTTQIWTVYMRPIMARGEWSGSNPFTPSAELDPDNPYIAAITRATIRWNKLIPFWRYVPTSQKSLAGNSGLLFTKGIGEAPIIQMATFSIWKNLDSLNEFAYRSREHIGAIQRTRDIRWYREELFSRFQPYRTEGTWDGIELKL
jgi:heme-degrading monooxygenase HmoA